MGGKVVSAPRRATQSLNQSTLDVNGAAARSVFGDQTDRQMTLLIHFDISVKLPTAPKQQCAYTRSS